MDIQTFIQNFREAFGEKAELPLVFWYSDTQEGTAEKINGCIFKGMKTAREGGIISFIQQIGVLKAEKKSLHFARIDRIESLKEVEGVVFIANPDMLSGLTTWAYYDNNAEDGVVSMFGSGCSCIVTQATIENRKGGKRTFIGFFDPSVRPYFEPDKLSYTIPMSRFREMCGTMRQSCLFDTHAWGKIRERMDSE